MKKEFTTSGFKQLEGIEYFDFEEDFVEKNMRCIPMTVRFKMDATGIKLKLAEWSKFSSAERIALALKPAETNEEAELFPYLPIQGFHLQVLLKLRYRYILLLMQTGIGYTMQLPRLFLRV